MKPTDKNSREVRKVFKIALRSLRPLRLKFLWQILSANQLFRLSFGVLWFLEASAISLMATPSSCR